MLSNSSDERDTTRSRYFLPLLFAALWNLFIGAFGLLQQEYASSIYILELTPMTGLATSNLVWCLALLAGIGYGIVAFAHRLFRFCITFGAILNTVFFSFVAYLWLGSLVTNLFFLAAAVDLVLASYFVWFLYQTREWGYL